MGFINWKGKVVLDFIFHYYPSQLIEGTIVANKNGTQTCFIQMYHRTSNK